VAKKGIVVVRTKGKNKMNSKARKNYDLLVIWNTIRSAEARLVYEKNQADIDAMKELISNLYKEYAQLRGN
jgi:hypothetical protein